MNNRVHIAFDNRYIQVAEVLFSRQPPEPVKQPGLVRINDALAEALDIDAAWLRSEDGLAMLAGNNLPQGAEPIATVYAGHQFGSWNPQLGDGRAILLGEVIGRNGLRYDIQLKGAGVTPYSRMGDGRSPLGPVLREYIVSEAMAALGVPTTRALAAVTSGEHVMRESILPGGILTRVARSHIRVGTFQYFAAREDWDTVRQLADHVIERHYPESTAADNPYLEMLSQVIKRQAHLIAQWQSLGFIHGVMNTDNMLVGGETVDYGPCAFMEAYNPNKVFSSIDQGGRYAYANQPAIGQWNLAWLAQSLLPLIDADEATAIKLVQEQLDGYIDIYMAAYRQRLCKKIGLPQATDDDHALLMEWLALMAKHQLDFTLGFRVLSGQLGASSPTASSTSDLLVLPDESASWIRQWHRQLSLASLTEQQTDALRQAMDAVNPVFIPRNHLVEAAIEAGYNNDFTAFHALVDTLATPFDYDPSKAALALPATPEQEVCKTFCGT